MARLRAVRAGLDMLRRLESWNKQLAGDGKAPWEIGVGVHTGEVIAGNIGSAKNCVRYGALADWSVDCGLLSGPW